ncbi:hypothetical protein BX600DRAFT_125068 [Xylariales sp. PMI_506]|nr:hypothetical protein BX600DRAFT_125068 [Xylariales sp. PMI_506]
MSRALDKDTLENLKSEDATVVYKDISKLLTALPDEGLLEIELLGKAHPLEAGVHFLKDENAVAIPKLRLVQAFFIARRIVQSHIAISPQLPAEETIAATAVMLLMDPEHLTAANLRKKAVLAKLSNTERAKEALQAEKKFVDSLLTARLHRHTKSPTLWNHRRWLLCQYRGLGHSLDISQDLSTVVMVAAERHPKNYYAWDHARWLLRNHTASQNEEIALATALTESVKLWCFKHHDDISGWSYLGFVVLGTRDQETRSNLCTSVATDTLNMVGSFQWTNESVWIFLRTLIATELINDELFNNFVELNETLNFSLGKEGIERSRLISAVQWSRLHRQRAAS